MLVTPSGRMLVTPSGRMLVTPLRADAFLLCFLCRTVAQIFCAEQVALHKFSLPAAQIFSCQPEVQMNTEYEGAVDRLGWVVDRECTMKNTFC